MNNFTKLILTSAVFVTSGFAETTPAQQNGGTISGVGRIDEGATMEMKANILTRMEDGASYITIV